MNSYPCPEGNGFHIGHRRIPTQSDVNTANSGALKTLDARDFQNAAADSLRDAELSAAKASARFEEESCKLQSLFASIALGRDCVSKLLVFGKKVKEERGWILSAPPSREHLEEILLKAEVIMELIVQFEQYEKTETLVRETYEREASLKDRITKSRRLEKELSEKVDRNYEIQQRRDKERQSAQGFWKSLGQLGKELATISEWKTSDGELNRIRTEIFLLGRRDAEPEMERCVKDRLTAQNGVTELRGGMRVNLDQLAPIGFADASPSQALIDRLRQESEDAAFVHVNDGFDLLQFLPHFPIISTQVSDFQKVEDDMYAALENLRNAEARLGTAREEYKNYTDQKWLEKLHSMAERIGVVGREVLRHSSVSKESVNTVTAYSADRDNRPCKDEISSLDWALTRKLASR